MAFIDDHREVHGVEPICTALQFAPSTYYHRKRRERDPSPRAVRDAQLCEAIERVHDDAFGGVYGYRKVHRQLRRQGVDIGRDATLRLMRLMGRRGATRGRAWKTTTRQGRRAAPPDLVERDFSAPAPDRLWVADFTYVATWNGFAYVAFVIDVFSRRIVGWRAKTTMDTALVLDAYEQAVHARLDADGASGQLVCHADRGSQYLSLAYSERLADEGIRPSCGSVGDSYDNALAESVIGLFKTEVIRRLGPWRNLDDVEYATLEWVDWFNHRRLHTALDYLTPAEHETAGHAARQLDDDPALSPTGLQ